MKADRERAAVMVINQRTLKKGDERRVEHLKKARVTWIRRCVELVPTLPRSLSRELDTSAKEI